MAATVTLSAGILVCPRGDVVRAAGVRAFVARLLEWSRLLEEPWIAVLTTKHAGEALASDGVLTFHEEMAELLRANGVAEYSANDIMQVIYELLYKPPWLEDCFGMRDDLLGWEAVTTHPDVLGLAAGPHLRRELERCLVLLALRGGRCSDGAEHHVVALASVPDTIVEVSASVQGGGAGPSASVESRKANGRVVVCDNVPGLILGMDECELLRNATDDAEVDLACRVALYKGRRARGAEVDWKELGGWRVGGRFREAAQNCCRDSADGFAAKLLRAVVETVDGQSLAAVHPLRTGAGGGNPQRRRGRDGAAAWRRDVDYEYHLHYWSLDGGVAELGWVGSHNDFWIPE